MIAPVCLYCEGKVHIIDGYEPSPSSDFECDICGVVYQGMDDYIRQRERKNVIEECPPELQE